MARHRSKCKQNKNRLEYWDLFEVTDFNQTMIDFGSKIPMCNRPVKLQTLINFLYMGQEVKNDDGFGMGLFNFRQAIVIRTLLQIFINYR